jgi:MFS family permease
MPSDPLADTPEPVDAESSSQDAQSAAPEDPRDISGQDRLTVEADVEVSQPELVRLGWVANTFRSFKHRDFTLFWSGALVSNVGTWMQNAALVIVVYSFAKDPRQASLFAGIVGFISGAPVFFLAIPAGTIADRFDRRKLLIWIQVVLLAQAAALGVLYDSHILGAQQPVQSLLLVSGLGMIAGIFSAFMMPAFQSLLPDLVPRDSLMNAIALNSAQFQSSRMIGPLVVSAFVLAGAGMGVVFYANAASFIFVIAALMAIRPQRAFEPGMDAAPHGRPGAHGAGPGAATGGAPGGVEEGTLKRVLAGVAYARENKAVGMLIISTAMLTIFGFPYMTLLAAIVGSTLGGDQATVGREVAILMAFNGLGALIGALGIASLPATVRRNKVIPLTLLTVAVFIVAFSLVHVMWTMAIFSTLAGAALMATNSLSLTSIQAAVPGRLRGRVMALFVMAFMGIMPFSALLFGPLGSAVGPDRAVFGAGIILAIWAAVLIANPSWLAGLQDEHGNQIGGPGAASGNRAPAGTPGRG